MPKLPFFVSVGLVYVGVISLLSAVVTVWDKRQAEAHRRRVPEATLFALALLGGSAAMYLTMRRIRHKTRKRKFMVGIPLIFLIQLAAAAGIGFWLNGSGGALW